MKLFKARGRQTLASANSKHDCAERSVVNESSEKFISPNFASCSPIFGMGKGCLNVRVIVLKQRLSMHKRC